MNVENSQTERLKRSEELRLRRSGDVAMVHSWDLSTAADGPGSRMTIFLAGCSLRCQYCQNPDTWFERDGVPTPFEDVFARVMRYRRIFQATGGGITLSGGEPLQQTRFVERLFSACAQEGIHTALDTAGYWHARASDELLDNTNLVLLDIKSGIQETYRTVTQGRSLAPTLAFGKRLSVRGTKTWIRFVLVPGLTDAPDNLKAIAEVVSTWSAVDRLDVLPFHQLGKSKWEKLGRYYPLADARTPNADEVERAREIFREYGITTY